MARCHQGDAKPESIVACICYLKKDVFGAKTVNTVQGRRACVFDDVKMCGELQPALAMEIIHELINCVFFLHCDVVFQVKHRPPTRVVAVLYKHGKPGLFQNRLKFYSTFIFGTIKKNSTNFFGSA